MGNAAFSAQYLQNPIPAGGGIFDWSLIQICATPPEFSELIMSVDVGASLTGNYTAITLWGHRERHWYFCGAYRFKYELANVRQKIMQLDQRHRPDLIVIDGVGVGAGVWSEMRNDGYKHIEKTRGEGKENDAWAASAMTEAGRVHILKNAFGLEDFRNEVMAFPNGKYCDEVDSMVQALKNRTVIIHRAQLYKRAERRSVPCKPLVELRAISSTPRRLVSYV